MIFSRSIEAATQFVWPSIEEKPTTYGVFRYAHGYTKRANSLLLFNSSQDSSAEIADSCEEFFITRKLPPTVRIQAHRSTNQLDAYLQRRGFIHQCPSLVMSRSLESSARISSQLLSLEKDAWLDVFYGIGSESSAQRQWHEALLGAIKGETLYASLQGHDGKPACCALAIRYGRVIGIFNVVTAPAYRRQHLASQLLTGLLDWGKTRGASNVFLQVEEANQAAIDLYRKLGFQVFNRYWYRIKDLVPDFKVRE